MAERSLADKVYAAIHFGTPDQAITDEIMSELTEWRRDEHPKVPWHPSDLDRCIHGRHSTDYCDGCGGQSTGNLILLGPWRGSIEPPPPDIEIIRRLPGGTFEVRIGTMVHGEPIWVDVRR